MFFVSNLPSSSQAGRRGFESRLPLQESITYENHENRAYCVKLSATTESPLVPASGPPVISDPDPTGVDIHGDPQSVAPLVGCHSGADSPRNRSVILL
jgi:hypothetical protein